MSGKFELLTLIGTGTFGEAWIAKSLTNGSKCVVKVVKILKLSEKELEQSLTEVNILARMNHNNIVKYYDAYVENGSLNIAMEYADGGDLHRKISNQKGIHFGKQVVVEWFVQICLALKYIHSQNILHRDLKSQNIFLTADNKVKLGDFGIARILRDSRDHAVTAIGTPFYLSPEICQKKPYNHKSDMWALGCVLYEMCCLHVPFDAEDFQGLILKILQEKYEPIPKHLGTTLSYLVTKLLDKNPDRRPSANEIVSLTALKPVVQRHEQKPEIQVCDKLPGALEAGSFSNNIPLEKPLEPLRLGSGSNNHQVEKTAGALRARIASTNIPVEKEKRLKNPKDQVHIPRHKKDNIQLKAQDKENVNPMAAGKTYLVQNPKFRHMSVASPKIRKIVTRQRRVHSNESVAVNEKYKQTSTKVFVNMELNKGESERRFKDPERKQVMEKSSQVKTDEGSLIEKEEQQSCPKSSLGDWSESSKKRTEDLCSKKLPFKNDSTGVKVSKTSSNLLKRQEKSTNSKALDIPSKKEDFNSQTDNTISLESHGFVKIWRDATDVLRQDEEDVVGEVQSRRSSFDPTLFKNSHERKLKANKIRRSSLEPLASGLPNRCYDLYKRRSSIEPDTKRSSISHNKGVSGISKIPRSCQIPAPRPSPIGSEFSSPLMSVSSQHQRRLSYQLSDDNYSESEEEVFLPFNQAISFSVVSDKFPNIDICDKYNKPKSKLIFGPQKKELDRAMRRSSSYDTIIEQKKALQSTMLESPIQRAHSTGNIEKQNSTKKTGDTNIREEMKARHSSKTYRLSGSPISKSEQAPELEAAFCTGYRYAIQLTYTMYDALCNEMTKPGHNSLLKTLQEKLGPKRLQFIIGQIQTALHTSQTVQSVLDSLSKREVCYIPLIIHLVSVYENEAKY